MQRQSYFSKATCGEDRRICFPVEPHCQWETKTVSSDILIGVAKEFKVSTDYILGLSTLSVRKSYDISELGLSEGAVTDAMFQTMQETMKDHQQELLSMDDVTAMIAGQIGKFLPMDEETAEQFRQLAKRMMEQVGK